ncbi:MAG TPA: discoidin domain-containing protein, partial [Sumerlaeia bacterium]|nr:discoidin domain-containing protein [Sumerlaeia bacterium]
MICERPERDGRSEPGKRHRAALFSLLAVFLPVLPASAADLEIHSDKPNVIAFPLQDAKFVRMVIFRTSDTQACIDELEIYGTNAKRNLASPKRGAKASASSCLPGHAIHKTAHLNDGLYGNSHSWIAASTEEEWAQIELPKVAKVRRIVFSRDRKREFADRVPVQFEIRLSLDGKEWKTVRRVDAKAAFVFLPARTGSSVPQAPLRVAIDDAGYAAKEPIRYAFLGEEHAWLKTYGRAALSPGLVPYNGRVKEYPRHAPDDRLPLPPLSSEPTIDGRPDDACWREASRGEAREAFPYYFDSSPCMTHAVTAGRRSGDLFLLIQLDQLPSRHVAVVSAGDLKGCGAVALEDEGCVFRVYDGMGNVKTTPIECAANADLTCFEMRLPLSLFPDCEETGIRVGLGLGGKHASNLGRAVDFRFSPLAVAQEGPCVDGAFRVRFSAPAGARPVTISGNVPELERGLVLTPGAPETVAIAAKGPIGPEFNLAVYEGQSTSYTLHLFRYDPLERALTLMDEMIERFAAKGIDVAEERRQLAAFRETQDRLMALPAPDPAAERRAFYEARLAKRRLFFRDPDLDPMEKILFVKRHAFQPSHNYSVLLDAPFRPGGAVAVLEVPRRDGRFEPSEAKVATLFDSGGGIARNPMANFDLTKIYFAYRESEDGYFRIMRMGPDGGNLTQLTDGPFHDYWPCPLPDGGLAFISTRCKARYLCWRPQAAVMFRMDADGSGIRPLSYANLTEWAPSVMNDGRIIWQRSEYIDKGADFSHTLWAIRPDGSKPELVFGNTIIQPNGYANGREVPGAHEICCTLISHFGDLNGPIALLDLDKGRFNPKAVNCLTPEV